MKNSTKKKENYAKANYGKYYKFNGNAHSHRSLSNVLSQKENTQDLLLTLHLSITNCCRS